MLRRTFLSQLAYVPFLGKLVQKKDNNSKEQEKINQCITLIIDRIKWNCVLLRAGRSDRWREDRAWGGWSFDRIRSIKYYRTYHVEGDKFDHSMYLEWKKPIGQPLTNPSPTFAKKHEGEYFAPCNFGFHINLWHPDSQDFQEALPSCSKTKEWKRYRPTYNFSEEEVMKSLKIICEHYGWELERGEDGRWMIL